MFLRNIFEAIQRTGQGKTAVVGWGRGMGHKGHMMLASSVITQASKVGGDPYFVVSKTVGKDDPITPDEKIAIYKKVFPQSGHIFQPATDEIPDLTRVLANLNQQGYTSVTVVLGADQVKAFQYLKNYNNKPDKSGNILYSFDNLDVISRQETGDPSAGEEGPRATPMRAVLMDPSKSEQEQFQVWRDAMSPEIGDDEVRDLMMKAKQRMQAMVKPKKGLKEMDKSQTPPGRDGHVSHGTYGSRDKKDPDAGKKQYTAKGITAKQATTAATDILSKAFKDSQRVDPRTGKKMVQKGVAEVTGDKPFDKMMTTIKQGTNKQKTADRKEQQKQTQQRARDAFGNMFGGGNPADQLKIREQGVAEGSGMNVVKSVKVGNFRHDLVNTGMGWQVRIYNGDELYDTGLSKNSEEKGLAALDNSVAYTKKQLNIKEQGVAEGLDPDQRARLDDLINTYRDATDPSNDGYGVDDHYDPDEVLDQIRQEFGDNVANKVEAGTNKMHFPRQNHSSGYGDSMRWKEPIGRITKAGKMFKQDSDYRKNTLKSRLRNTGKVTEQGVAEGLNEFAQGDFNGSDDSNDLQLYLNVAKKLNMKKYKPSTAHDLIAKKMAELVDAVDDEKVDWARHMARKAQGLPSMLDQQGVAEDLSEMDNRTPSGDRREQRANSPEAKAQREKEQQKRLKDTSPEMRKKLRLPEPKEGVAEAGSNAMDTVAKRLTNPKDGMSAKLRAAGDKKRDSQYMGSQIAKNDRTSKDEWGNLKELSNDTLGRYKKAASADATAADKAGDYKRADKRFSGIVNATKKQFANDAKSVPVSEGVENIMDNLINKIIMNEAISNNRR